jgi:hypothetical protein
MRAFMTWSEAFKTAFKAHAGKRSAPMTRHGHWGRFDETALGGNQPPMRDADLMAAGLINQPSGIENLAVYVEYYRSIQRTDAAGIPVGSVGVMDDPANPMFTPAACQTGEFRTVFTNSAKRDAYRLVPDPAPGAGLQALVGPQDPILIRIIVTWGDSGRTELFTGRKR